MDNSIFDKVEKNLHVKKEDILLLAKTISSQDLEDERQIKKLIKKVSLLVGKEVSKEKEAKIIEAIKKDKVPKSLDGLK